MDRSARDSDDLFFAALEIEDAAARASFLDEACGPDAGLRGRVERLLAANSHVGRFLEPPSAVATVTGAMPSPRERPGEVIGPYKLLEAIGEGGMGVVYMAEQTVPVRRKVALKVIKPGMDTRQVVARFEAERQALAMMDHPNIARVLDAGATQSGRPYFVMELVHGVPITDYCDREQLPLNDRLDLFVLVCRAVQHAHQKGIIHRDIKPTNVLITLHDGVPVPKVIDFGIAKATGGQLTEKTLFTAFAQLVGTPLYMSPEQAELSGLDIDTRSDIYSLGVLLYELMTGTTPFDAETLRKATFDEMRRIIREDQPPTPSTRLATLRGTSSTVSANRGSDLRRLGQRIRGDLDWIVMKALEKDRRRRYETANDFAADVVRHLADQPVEACPPSAWYRFAKFARRNRAALTTAATISLLLIGSTAFCAWQAVRATRAERRANGAMTEARDKAEQMQRVVDFLAKDVFGAAAPEKAQGKGVTSLDILSVKDADMAARFRGQPLVEAAVRLAIADAYTVQGQYGRAEPQVARVVEIRARQLGPEHPETLAAEASHAFLLRCCGQYQKARYETAERAARHVLEARRRVLGSEHHDTRAIMSELAVIVMSRGRLDEALSLGEQAVAADAHRPGPRSKDEAVMRHNLVNVLHVCNQLERAEDVIRTVVEDYTRLHGPDHRDTLNASRKLGIIIHERGRIEEAQRLLQDNLERTRRVFGIDDLRISPALERLSVVISNAGGIVALRDFHRRWLREFLATPIEDAPIWRHQRTVLLGKLALELVTLPGPNPADTALALSGAERVASTNGQDSVLTLLALAHYRSGDLDKAQKLIQASIEQKKRQGGFGYDWFVLALIHARRGELNQARVCYERGLAWDDSNVVWIEIYRRVRDEAAVLLEVKPPLDPKLPGR